MTKERLARDAEIFRLLRAFRPIKNRAARRRIVETVEAMAENRTVTKAQEKDTAGKPR